MCQAWHWTPLVLLPLTGLPRGYGVGGYLWLFLKVTGSGLLLTAPPPPDPALFSTPRPCPLGIDSET